MITHSRTISILATCLILLLWDANSPGSDSNHDERSLRVLVQFGEQWVPVEQLRKVAIAHVKAKHKGFVLDDAVFGFYVFEGTDKRRVLILITRKGSEQNCQVEFDKSGKVLTSRVGTAVP